MEEQKSRFKEFAAELVSTWQECETDDNLRTNYSEKMDECLKKLVRARLIIPPSPFMHNRPKNFYLLQDLDTGYSIMEHAGAEIEFLNLVFAKAVKKECLKKRIVLDPHTLVILQRID